MMLFWHKQKKRLSLTCAGFRNLEILLAQVLPVSRSLLTVFSELVINELLTSNDTRSSPKHFSRNDNTLFGRWCWKLSWLLVFEVLEEDFAGCSKKNEEMEEILLKQLKKQLKQLWQL